MYLPISGLDAPALISARTLPDKWKSAKRGSTIVNPLMSVGANGRWTGVSTADVGGHAARTPVDSTDSTTPRD